MPCQNDCKEEFKEIFRRLNECEKDIRTCQNNKDFFIKYLDDLKETLKDFSFNIEKLEKSHNMLLGIFIFVQIFILPIVFMIISKYF